MDNMTNYEKMSKREKLIDSLNININTSLAAIYEKLFCASLLKQGTKVTAEVLGEYHKLKETLYGRE